MARKKKQRWLVRVSRYYAEDYMDLSVEATSRDAAIKLAIAEAKRDTTLWDKPDPHYDVNDEPELEN